MIRTWLGGILVLGFALGAVPRATAEKPSANQAVIPFAPGEECNFVVKFGFVKAGTATLAVQNSNRQSKEPLFRLISSAKSSRFFSTFFLVDDLVESHWSPNTLLPEFFEKRIREGKYEKDETIRFDQEAGKAHYQNGEVSQMTPYSQDVLSAFYYVRTQPLRVGSTISIPSHTDGKNYPLEVKIMRKEKIKVKAGTYNCFVVEPLLKSAGLFKQEGRLTIWITDDARRIPVLMKSKVAVGSIVAELESYRPGRRGPAMRQHERAGS